jgi:type VI secretion system secreted protein VgrG
MQTTRHATVTTPLGEELSLRTLHGRETLGQPFRYDLELLSDNFELDGAPLLGQAVTVRLQTTGDSERYFNGIATHFSYGGTHGNLAAYHVTLRPWLWLLSHTALNQVYQRVSIPELVLDIVRSYGFTDVEPLKLVGNYRKREYIVQYQESLLNFISRWLEHEGIYYYFKHRASGHTLCLADICSSSDATPNYEEVPFHWSAENPIVRDHISAWRETSRVITGTYASRAFDFKKPKADLFVSNPVPTDLPRGETELYEAPGTYEDPDVGQAYARLRAEELHAGQTGFEGSGNVRGLAAGAVFKLADYPRKALNREYLVVSSAIAIDSGEFESNAQHAGLDIHTQLSAIDARVPYRPARVTPHPVLSGPQTAIVVGSQGTEICSDEYGRIKVQFHWDREHQHNEDSSCWVRVAQSWAGSGFGAQFIPRVGQEVLVDFLEGNPDLPIIIGSVYNRDNMPPYPPHTHATQSGFKTRSSKGASPEQFNELRFEDRKGSEQLYLQAQRNMDTLVKQDQSLDVGGKRTKKITGSETNTIEGGRTTTIEKFDNLLVNSANKNTTVHGQFNTIADEHFKVQQNATQLFMKDKVFIESDGDIELKNGGVRYVGGQSGKLVISVNSEIDIRCGAASISLKKDGTIKITGTSVTVGTKTNNAQYEAQGVTVSGAKISQTAVGIHEIAGALVKLG